MGFNSGLKGLNLVLDGRQWNHLKRGLRRP